MNKLLSIFLTCAMIIYCCGCSIFVESTQEIFIDGEPSGAKAIVDGTAYITPCKATIKRNNNISILISKDGYIPQTMTSNWDFSTTGLLDLAGAYFLILPGIGLFFPGAYIHKKNNHYYVLAKENSAIEKNTIKTDK